ncbi:hypothetical protein Tco_0983636 [Tanacetum coccineum]
MIRSWSGTVLSSYVEVALCKCSSTGRLLSAHNLRVATPRALVHVNDKTSGDAWSCYMISEDAKSWVVIVLHIFTVILHNCLLFEILAQQLGLLQTYELTNIIVDIFEYHFQVMSTPTYVDLETITHADGAQSSCVPVPLLDDPYVAVRHAQLVDTDTESEPEEAPSKAEESQPLASSDSTVPLSPDHPLTHASPTPTPTRVLVHRRTARMVVRTQPTLSPGMSARIMEATTLSSSSFHKRYRSSYETLSPSLSLTLPIRKRYRGTSELILDIEIEDESSDSDAEGEGSEEEGPSLDDEGHGLEDEGPSSKEEEEENAPEGQQ